jgi:DNA-3-methyladenine glycosylase
VGPDLGSLLERPVLEVAPLLLGATLRHGDVALRLTEVEAYDGEHDPGSHAHRGQTPRNSVMFGSAGHLYVYFTYGMHHCCNVVCGPEGTAAAVLLRAGEVVDGLETARERRPRCPDRDLARGPARLCRALGIDLDQNGARLDTPPLTLEPGPAPETVASGPRVGLRLASDRAWRFWLPEEPTVSRYRSAVARPRPRMDR